MSAATLPMTEFQQRVLQVPETVDVAMLGSRGSGKSTGLALMVLQHVELHRENARVLLVRASHFGIQHIQSIVTRLFAQAYGRALHSTTQPARLKARGAVVDFNMVTSEYDLQKYLSGSYTFVACDQADEYVDPTVLDLLRSLLRSSEGKVPCRFVLCANAGGLGSGWLKSRFLDQGNRPWEVFTERQSARPFVVARSLLRDNTFVDERAYTEQLRASAANDEARLRQWLDDSWDVVRGGMFDDLWDRRVHVLTPFAIPRDWRISRSFDWGDSRPFSVGWWATANGNPVKLANGEQRTLARGSEIRIAEWYGWNGTPNRGLRLHPSAIAKGIAEREERMGLRGRVQPGPADSAIFDRVSMAGGNSIAELMAAPPAHIHWLPADKSPGARARGWQKMRELLAGARDGGGRGLFVFDNCAQFLRTVPGAPRDVVAEDDIDTDYEDHILDEARYFCYRRAAEATMRDMHDHWRRTA